MPRRNANISSIRSNRDYEDVQRVRTGLRTVEQAPSLPVMPFEESLRVRLTQAGEIGYLRQMPDRGRSIEWPLAGR